MNGDRYAVGSESKQPTCFYHFQPFVHQRRRINRDLRTHLPGRMRKRLFDSSLAHALDGRLPKRPARCSENQSLDFARLFATHALMQRVVLAINRQKFCARLTRRASHKLACHNKRFFVGKADAPTERKRSVSRQETYRADG